MQLGGMDVGAGCSRPGARFPHVRNIRSAVKLVAVQQPARYFKHEVHERPSIFQSSAFAKQYHYLHKRRRLPFLCRAAGTDTTSPGSSSPSSSSPLPNLDPEEMEQRIRRASNFITTSEKLIPFDPSSTNLGLVIWQALRDIPPQHRPELISRLSSGDIRRLWKVAGQRYTAPPSAIAAALGPEYSLWQDLPRTHSEISYFTGKAALPTHALGISGFSKAFFLAPVKPSKKEGILEDEEEVLSGRVIHPTPLGNYIYPGPMYFESCIGPTIVPLTGELCDMTISYLDPDEIRFDPGKDIPRSAWPQPRVQRRPFDQGYVDYVRAAGPGVLVGMGYRTRSNDQSTSGVPLVPSPLYFVMIKSKTEDLSS